MAMFNKKTIVGNRHSLKQLNDFRNNVVSYFNNVDNGFLGDELNENAEARRIRSVINQNLLCISDIISESDVATVMQYTPPRAVGGYIQNIEVISNIFNLYSYGIQPRILLDFVDRAIGVYKNDEMNSLVRTFNPFFWSGLLLDYIVNLPFKLLGKAGMNVKQIEDSNIGKISKFIMYIVTLLSGVITIAQALGWLEGLKELLGF